MEWSPIQLPVTPEPSPPAAPPSHDTGSDFKRLLASLGRELDLGEALVERARTGGIGGLGAAELIAVQAGIYRYAEAVELTAKFVDRAQNAIRTTLESGAR